MRRLLPFVILALLVAPLYAQPATQTSKTGPPAQPWGTWYWVTDISGVTGMTGSSLPTVISFHEDGTFACAEGNSFGGVPNATFVYTTGLGTWVRMGGGAIAFEATRLGFVFDKASGILKGIGRSRFTFRFAGDFEHITGTLFVETLSCAAPIFCPDPLDPDATWVPTSPPGGFSGTAMRVHAIPVPVEP